MNNEKQPKGQPMFKPWTKEMMDKEDKRMDEVCKKASENLRKGIYPPAKRMVAMPTQTIELIQHPWAETRMLWMKDHCPDYLRELHQQGDLKSYVEKKVREALALKRSMMEKGMFQDEAEEVALNDLAPPEVPESTEYLMGDREFYLILSLTRDDQE